MESIPNVDVGFGLIRTSSNIITPESPAGLKLNVHGAYSDKCADCPKVVAGGVLQYTVKVKKIWNIEAC